MDSDVIEFLNFLNAKHTTNKIDIDAFCLEHKHIRYCESIIYRDGRIAYVKPSHTESLMRECMELFNMTKDELEWLIPYNESPLIEMIKLSGCIALWYEFAYTCKDITSEQKESLKKLIEHGCVCPTFEMIEVN